LASSAKGALRFEWFRGAVAQKAAYAEGSSKAEPIPPALAHFDRWTAAATIANGAMTLQQNQVLLDDRKRTVVAKLTFGNPPKASFAASRQMQAKAR